MSINTWVEVDVTSVVTGDGTYSFRISDSTGGADYSSKEGANAPQLVLTLGGTPAPTNTPTPGPSPTPTRTPTPSATPIATNTPTPTAPAAFSSAAFVYDGDGKRVKSILNGTITTYFVGAHYEVTGSTITKYYYAGSQRIAMRTNGILNYLLGDHLGSTSLTTSATGTVISELRYKAWGETRYASGTTATKYTYTGQYSYTADFGLMFYNARWYDPALGRFAQADTIIPGGVQGLDRYAYVNNSPIKYTDPSGHMMDAGDGGGCASCLQQEIHQNEVTLPDTIGPGWTADELTAIYTGWGLLILQFGNQEALENPLGGPIRFMRVPTGLLGDNVAARAFEPLNLILIDAQAFKAQGKKEWYVLHEIGHIFDMNDSDGDPGRYKSNTFVDAFIPGGCSLNFSGCTGSQWNPTDKNTTGYGLSDGSVEDFADSFASTVLYNYGLRNLSFRNVSQDRMNIINVWISIYAQDK